MDKLEGTVKWFSPEKGFGFVVGKKSGAFFVHHSAICGNGFKSLTSGQKIRFEAGRDARGPVAVNVQIINH